MKFSLFRFLIAVIPAAATLTFVRYLGHSVFAGLLFSAFIGIPLSIVVLIATKKDGKDLLKMLVVIVLIILGIVMIEVLGTYLRAGS